MRRTSLTRTINRGISLRIPIFTYHIRRLRRYPFAVLLLSFLSLGLLIILIMYFVLPNALHSAVEPLKQNLAVIVPFRDRFDELLQFVPHMTKFLRSQQISFGIFVINQIDDFRFNRGALINVGFLESEQTHGYFAMHDVDLLPMNPALSYALPTEGAMHIASPDLHPRYHYKKFIGGILLMTKADFKLVNGMSNKYWGWGMEDDEFYVRLNESRIEIHRPVGITTGYKSFRHLHHSSRRLRDTERFPGQLESMRRRDREGGVKNVAYTLLDRYDLHINGSKCTVINVQLQCDLHKTPWCAAPRRNVPGVAP